ncbi:MAG: M23 family metallopeptidase [Paludibacteraceae bacterium]|nr:M23 family metallopeptidase [Candidatus Colicola coprequi]MCQ2333868.1 M23 family metallopeptidase [Paludibacteraceae bacterium]
MENKESFWKRIRRKYRLSVLHEETLAESWHIRLSWLGLFTIFTLMFALTIGIFSVVIIYTPIRHILPGYSENIRLQLIEESAQVDSLSADLKLQMNYLDVIKQVIAGEVNTDTVASLDSMQIVLREQLLEAKQAATEEFIREYESKGKDNMMLFDVQSTIPAYTLFPPAHGAVQKHYVDVHDNFVGIQTLPNENVTSVLAGTIVYCSKAIDNTFTVIVQHDVYISVYRHVSHVLKQVGDVVQAGESIAIMNSDLPLEFALWQNGRSVNPEEVIAF